MIRSILFVSLVSASCLTTARNARSNEPLPRTPDSTDPVPELLETIGLLAGAHLYQTYLNIGFLADGRAEGTYEDDDVKKLLGSVLLPLEKVDRQLDKVARLAVTSEDREAIAELRKITALLRQEGKDLETFWVTGKESDGEKYEVSRQKAWQEIRDLLDLEPDTPTSEQAPAPRGTN